MALAAVSFRAATSAWVGGAAGDGAAAGVAALASLPPRLNSFWPASLTNDKSPTSYSFSLMNGFPVPGKIKAQGNRWLLSHRCDVAHCVNINYAASAGSPNTVV